MTAQIIYHADPLTGEYLGSGLSDADPLQEGNWLIPAHAYLDAPPAIPAGYTARRIVGGSGWDLVEDHRGTVYRTDTGGAVEHNELGPLPADVTSAPKPSPEHTWTGSAWAFDLTAIHANKVAAVNTACDSTITSGFTSSALGAPHHYSSDLVDQLNLAGSVLRGLDMPYACRDEQGVKAFRLHTAEQLRQVGDDFTLYKLQLLQYANDLKQQLDQALAVGDIETMERINWDLRQ